MKRGATSCNEKGAMNTIGFLTQQGPPNNGSAVHHLVNGGKRPAAEMEEGAFTQFTHHHHPHQLEIDEEEHADLSDDDDDDDNQSPGGKKSKKTKGRVKIKMEFIENKLRRYTTFSKRKTGIMKKAYELSTLTGTQVMLLVASETGHVYTFATRKLQPMITSESGKALIQTCLNSPDPASALHNHNHNPDQRMSATGFEETELTYQVTEEELAKEGKTSMFTVTNVPGAGADVSSPGTASTQSGLSMTGAGHTYPMTTYLPTGPNGAAPSAGTSSNHTNKGLGLSSNEIMAHSGGGYTTVVPQGTALQPGASIPAGVLQVQQGHNGPSPTSSGANQSIHPQHFLYRLQQPGGPTSPLILSPTVTTSACSSPVVTQSSLSSPPPLSSQSSSASTSSAASSSASQEAGTVYMNVSAPQPLTSSSASLASSPVMYHTSQGIIYATSPGSIPENLLLPSYQATTASHLHERSTGNTITGLVPVSTGLATTHATVPISKGVINGKQSMSHDRKGSMSNEPKTSNPRSFLRPPPTKHRLTTYLVTAAGSEVSTAEKVMDSV